MTTTLITGASSGMGLELAKQFAAGGDDIVLTARSEDKLNELAKADARHLTKRFSYFGLRSRTVAGHS